LGELTTTAFEKIQQWIPLEEITNPDGWWNGMMMKQFPLAAYFALKDASNEEDKLLLDITKVSHGYPAALVSAVVHHHFLKTLLQSDSKNLDKKQLIEILKDIAIREETKYPHREWKKISEVLSNLQECIENNVISLNDQQIFEKFGWGDTMKQAWFITVTLWVVYCLFLRDTSMQWVWDAVNFGGDTDTYASIIWNMAWALHWEIYDDAFLHGVQNIEELKQQVNDFISKLLS
jgi:ADP-ribosyl-[dinitrogen reductase] hydrolase